MKNQPKRFMLLSMLAVLLGTSLPAVAQTDYAIRTSALSEHDANAPIGFGAGVTGSGNANPITVTTRDALITALSVTDAQTIYVDGTIEFSGSVNISGVENKTVIGLPGATLSNRTHSATKSESGIMTLTNCQNIIIRNLIFKGAGAYDIDGYDNLTLTSSQNIWIDHCDFQDGVDGNLDCNNGSDNICVSWCRFSYKIVPWSGGSGGSSDHRFSNLWGSGDNVSADEGHLNTTFVNCWWDEGCKQRMPRIRFGQVHLLNCLYNSSVADYCIGAGYRSNAYVENCYFDTSYGAAWQNYASGSYTDYNITLTGNYGAADDQSQSGSISYFTPSYNYTAYNASDVKSTLTASNGAGATLQFGEDEEVVLSGTLIDFPTSQTGLTANGNTEFTTVESYPVCKFSSGYTGGNAGKNVALSVSGGFKTGDVITVAGFIKNTDSSKYGTATLFTATNSTGSEGITNIKQFENFANLANSEAIVEQTYTLTADYDLLFLGRYGNTATNLTVIKVVRPGEESGGEEPDPEPATWRDIKADFTNESFFTSSDEGVITAGLKMNGDGSFSRVEASDEAANAVITGQYHSKQHGISNFSATVKVEGAVKITFGTCAWGGYVTVKNSENTEVVPTFSTNTGACYHNNKTDNIVVGYYNGGATTLTIAGGSYVPYFAVEAVESSEIPSTATATFALGESGAEGTVPAAVEVNIGEKITIPANRTLWVDGKTLTAWTDGISQYTVGQEVTVNENMTLTPVFTTNTVAFADRTAEVTATWDFQQKNGAPVLNYQNVTGFYVTQITVNEQVIDFRLDFDTNNGGKLANGSWQDWAQVNDGTKFTLPAYEGTVYSTFSMNDNSATTFAGETGSFASNVNSYTYNGNASTIDIVISGGSYYRWVKAVYPVPTGGEEPDPGEEETGMAATIYWPMNEPANYTNNTVTSEAQFATVNVDLGVVRLMDANGKENATGTSTVSSGVTFSQMRPTNGGSDYVTWQVKPQAGQMFKPKKVSAYIVRFGTDAEHGVTFSARVGTGEPLVLGTYTAPRNNKSQTDDKFGKSDDYAVNGYVEINLTEEQQTALTSGDTFSLIGTIGVGNAKAGGIAQVTIEGTVSGSAQQFTTVYDLAAAMMTAPKNIEGFASSLAATSTEAGSNATDILVDATSGKLGKNNADWAQLNEGTILTIPGVPEGAQVTFALYNTTALTINGVAYTNGQTYTATKNENLTMTCTTGGYIKSITVVGSAFVYVPETEGYTNTWQFGKSNGAPEFALQGSPEYNYEVGDYSLIINTAAGKLNNASRTDQWAQCNNGTLFKVPMYAGSKLSWGRYNSGSDAGFVGDGKLFNEYYIASEESTVEFKAQGISYLSFIKIEPATLYEISGTITGGNIDGSTITLTAAGNGETYSAAIAEGAFTLKVPADTYTFDLSEDAPYVVSTPENLLINADGSIGEITITAAEPQDVTGLIANAPAEAFTLTFTGASHNKQVELAANATSFATTLDPDTYVISSSVGTLSPLSVESFKVLKETVSHNIYFPEEAVPAATQQNITVDNTAAVAANVYNTVTDALAAAKAGNISNPVITLTSGQTYQEQVIVEMPGVTLKTSGEEKATITFYYGIGYTYYSLNEKGYYDKDRAMTRNSILMKDPDRWGCTVKVTNKGNNFKAENIIFENSFNQRYTAEEVTDGVRPNGCQGITYDRTLNDGETGYYAADAKQVTERAAAIAFENNPSGCQLYKCRFVGSQDTFYSSGKIYVKDCDIIGNTDYIFGGGYVVFDDCNLEIGGYSDKKTTAYITAQKGSAGDAYIFRDCTVTSGARTYVSANLGRDWGGADATVYFFNLKNELGSDMSYSWTNMGDGVSAGTANLHIFDFDAAINANYNTTGSTGANINGVLSDENALDLYASVVSKLGFTPERIYEDKVELSESSAYNICRIAASDNVERDVTLTRTLAAGQWTAIVLPFSMTSEQIADAFGAGAKVAELSSTTNTALYFTTVDAMEANQPYIIQVSDDFTAANINGVTITKADPTVVFGGWTANGTYTAGKIPAGSHYISNNMVKKAADETNDITAMSVYFTNTFADAVELYVDGISTCIKDVKPGQPAGDIVYTLQGVRVEKAQKGLYIVNGRKAIVK